MTEMKNDYKANEMEDKCVKCYKVHGDTMIDIKPHLRYINDNGDQVEEYYKVCFNCGDRVLCVRLCEIIESLCPTYAIENTHANVWKNSFNYEDYEFDLGNYTR